MIEPSETEITLVRSKGGRRVIRVVHLPTGITVEDEVRSKTSVVATRNKLLTELEKCVEAGLASGTRRK